MYAPSIEYELFFVISRWLISTPYPCFDFLICWCFVSFAPSIVFLPNRLKFGKNQYEPRRMRFPSTPYSPLLLPEYLAIKVGVLLFRVFFFYSLAVAVVPKCQPLVVSRPRLELCSSNSTRHCPLSYIIMSARKLILKPARR